MSKYMAQVHYRGSTYHLETNRKTLQWAAMVWREWQAGFGISGTGRTQEEALAKTQKLGEAECFVGYAPITY